MINIFIILQLVLGDDILQHYLASLDDECSKVLTCYYKLYLPKNPLIYLSVYITLEDLDPPLSEYPTPNPVSYGRLNAVPNEIIFDYYISLKSKHEYLINQAYPKFSEFLIIRIDGGLLNEFHLFNAYRVNGWKCKINLVAYYCATTIFTSLPWSFDDNLDILCDTPLENINEITAGIVPSMFYISQGTAEFIITSSGDFSLSSNNYDTNMIKKYEKITNPSPGWWFLISNSSTDPGLALEIIDCTFDTHITCNKEILAPVDIIFTYTEIPLEFTPQIKTNANTLTLIFENTANEMKYRYGIAIFSADNPRVTSVNGEICTNSNVYCEKTKGKLVAELQYLPIGMQYIKINIDQVTAEYKVSLFKTEIGSDICHGEQHFDYADIVYNCYCIRNKAGFYWNFIFLDWIQPKCFNLENYFHTVCERKI